jgi:hypothetical protein
MEITFFIFLFFYFFIFYFYDRLPSFLPRTGDVYIYLPKNKVNFCKWANVRN